MLPVSVSIYRYLIKGFPPRAQKRNCVTSKFSSRYRLAKPASAGPINTYLQTPGLQSRPSVYQNTNVAS
ncbi:hypothetical protein DPMN_076256 [Dreissena polymorpha]|uniref:Uncharacterized protein n=1 Tax=Dreissena polymorpha TaxID=45954 RepID=A0A9D3YLY4_DREPO|nr:hypothetical protein DPMN_076256 [Dreissena polymorpha]